MAQRVFLHIGVPKSGTTFLQTLMWHNRPQLRRQGFLYPGRNRMEHYHASVDVRRGEEARAELASGAWTNLVSELADWPGTGLISHEFFCLAKTPQARRAIEELAPAEVDVVLTARDYVRQFPAVWQEALKMRSDASLDEFMEDAFARRLPGAWSWRSQDVPRILGRWATTVPVSRIHIVTVPPAGAPRHLLWDRWCEVLGIDATELDTEVHFANESLGAPQAALLRRVKPYLGDSLTEPAELHRWVRQYFGHEVLGPQRGARFGLRPEHVARLQRRAEKAVSDLAAAGYQVTGDLADLVPPDYVPLPHPDDVTDAEMTEVAARAIAQMIDDVRALNASRSWRRPARDTRTARSWRSRVAERIRALHE